MAPTNLSQANTLRQGWLGYIASLPEIIGSPYEYWGTLTYKDHAEIPRQHSSDIITRRFNYFIRIINEKLYGKRWMRQGKGVFGVVANEKAQDYPHHHFIMGGIGLRAGMRRLDLMDTWEDIYKGWARCEDYKGDAAAKYLTKYITKGGTVDVYATPRDRQKLKT